GYSPLPVTLVQAGFEQTSKLRDADAGVDLTSRDVSTCNNPTFIAGQPDRNYLAEIAPQPDACDQSGQGPCVDAGASAVRGSTGGATSGSNAAPGATSRTTAAGQRVAADGT